MSKTRLVAAMLALMVAIVVPMSVLAQDITALIKIFGIGYVVKQFADPLNNFANTLLNNQGFKVLEQTKVVPVLSIGVGQASYIGAAQVSGPASALRKVEAVAQMDGDFNTVFRIKALVPIDSANPVADGIHRVSGAGVTAVIDIRI